MPRSCEHEGCPKHPTFALEGETRPRWCVEHKTAEAVDIVNKNKLCEHEGCPRRCTFALEGETRPRWCACGKERPDFWWDCGAHAVVLEVDENQHGGRPEE